jgi:hypothetical protein
MKKKFATILLLFICLLIVNNTQAIRVRAVLKKCFTYTAKNTIHTIELKYFDGKLQNGHIHTLATNDAEMDYDFEILDKGKLQKINILEPLEEGCNINYKNATFTITTDKNGKEQLKLSVANNKLKGKTNKAKLYIFNKCSENN